MIKPSELKKIADERRKSEAQIFIAKNIEKIFESMKERAELGLYDFTIHWTDRINNESWLSKPHIYNEVIEYLEAEGYTVRYYNGRDEESMTISWF